MSEEMKTTPETAETKADQTEVKTAETEESTPDVQDLLVEVAKQKRAIDKLTSEAAEWRKKYQSTLSEKERASQEKAEQEAEREERYKQLLRENQMNKVEKSYLAQSWTADEAFRMATAEVDGDFDTKMKILAEVDARKAKEVRNKFLKDRPDLQYGSGAAAVSQEQFDKMSLAERTKLKRERPDEYKRLIGK